jgi:uncharacterized protein YjeT (DUF2065 family)
MTLVPWRNQRQALRLSGGVAVAAGLYQLLTGAAGVVGGRPGAVSRDVDSELRFYGAWYATAGALMLRAASGPLDRGTTRTLGTGWALAATGRVLSMRAVGRPHPLLLALGVAEAALAVELLGPADREDDGS